MSRRALSQSTGPIVRALGIETSCDDTAVGVVSSDRGILGQAIYSQRKEMNE
eukprot:Ihof_evm3s447 gene=Ihof_evmTU3s447